MNLIVAIVAGSVNTAADFLLRLKLKVTEKIRLQIREDIHLTPMEVTAFSSDVVDEEHFFFKQADNKNESTEHSFQRKEQSRQDAKFVWQMRNHPPRKLAPKNSCSLMERLRRISRMRKMNECG